MNREVLSQVQNSTYLFRALRTPVCTKPHFQSKKKGSMCRERQGSCRKASTEGLGRLLRCRLRGLEPAAHFSESWALTCEQWHRTMDKKPPGAGVCRTLGSPPVFTSQNEKPAQHRGL